MHDAKHSCCEHQVPQDSDKHTHALDKTGVSVSTLCLLHCLLLPLLTPFIPLFETIEESGLSHLFFALLVAPIAVLTFNKGYREHKIMLVPTLGYLGLIFIGSGFLMDDHGFLSKESILTSAGSILLVLAHLFNIRLCIHNRHNH